MDERITLEELGRYCNVMHEEHDAMACLKCEKVEYCNSYMYFVQKIDPRYWIKGKGLPNIQLSKSGYFRPERQI